MEVKVNDIENAQQEVEISLAYNEITDEISDAYYEERKKISLPGFRKGKVPIQMLKKLYRDAIEYQASEKIATKKFWEVVNRENLKPINTPQLTDINFEIDSKLNFKVKYEITPKLELKNYKNLEIEKPVFKIKDDEIDKEIDYLSKPYIKYEPADVVESNQYRITAALQRMDNDGVAMIGTRNENILIELNDEKVNPQIALNVKDKKVGDKFNFEFVDEHYHGEEKHREEYKYEGEITKIEKIVYPELNEEIIKKISGDKFSTIDELRANIRNNIEEYYKKQSDEIFVNSLLGTVVKNNDFEPPKGYVETIHKRLVELEKENAKKYGQKSFDEKAVSEYLQPRAVWNAKWQIILENLSEKENIKVEDSELEDIAKKESESTGISIEKLVKFYKDTNRQNVLLENKVIDFLKENTTIKEVDADKKMKEQKEKPHEA